MKDFGFDGNCDKFPVGMAYVPELHKPFTGRRCVKC